MTTAFPRALAQEDVCATTRDATPASLVSAAATVGVCLLIVAAPFETVAPLVSVPGQSVSSSEAVLVAVLGCWLAVQVRARQWPHWRTALTVPWGLWVAASLAAALLAPAFRSNAVAMSARLALALAVLILTVNGVKSWQRAQAVSVTAAAVGLLLSAMLLADYLSVGGVRSWLGSFRPGVAFVGAQVRASGPFQYPTIASMYLEILFALALPQLALALDARRPARATAMLVVLLAIAQANALTFTRAGLVTMTASIAVVAWSRYRVRGRDRVGAALALLAALVLAQFVASRSAEMVALRMTSEGQEAWYQAWIEAPARVDLPTGGVGTVSVTLTNTGRATWDSTLPQPFRVSYHWLTRDGTQVVSWEGRRTLFPEPVPPGGRVTMQMQVGAPRQPGEYRLMWDIELQHRLWFSTEPGAPRFVSTARVNGPVLGELGTLTPLPRPLQQGSVRPSRLMLWEAAARMTADRPWLGVGPDNYRLQYGSYLGLAESDPRIHSNNMYLEVLAGSGLVGAAAFALLLWRIAGRAIHIVRRLQPLPASADAAGATALAERMLGASLVAATAAIALHGLVDSFLSFTATYVLMAITLGLLVAGESLSRPHAHRV